MLKIFPLLIINEKDSITRNYPIVKSQLLITFVKMIFITDGRKKSTETILYVLKLFIVGLVCYNKMKRFPSISKLERVKQGKKF